MCTLEYGSVENALFPEIINNQLVQIIRFLLCFVCGGVLTSSLLRFPKHKKSVNIANHLGEGLNSARLETDTY